MIPTLMQYPPSCKKSEPIDLILDKTKNEIYKRNH